MYVNKKAEPFRTPPVQQRKKDYKSSPPRHCEREAVNSNQYIMLIIVITFCQYSNNSTDGPDKAIRILKIDFNSLVCLLEIDQATFQGI